TTFPGISADKKKQYEENKNRFFVDWLQDLAHDEDLNGVFVLITRDPPHIQVGVGRDTRKKAFTLENRDRLRDIFVDHFKNKACEGGLFAGIPYVRESLEHNLGRAPAATHTAPGPAGHGRSTEINPMGWICFGLVAIGVIWLVIGVVRSFTGGGGYGRGGYGGPGYGPGGYGGGGGRRG